MRLRGAKSGFFHRGGREYISKRMRTVLTRTLVCTATACGLEAPLRLSSAPFGDAVRCAVSRHQLSSGELDLSGRDARTWSNGPTPRGPWACGEVHLHLPAVPLRAASTHTRLRAALDPVGRRVMVNGWTSLRKPDHRWGASSAK